MKGFDNGNINKVLVLRHAGVTCYNVFDLDPTKTWGKLGPAPAWQTGGTDLAAKFLVP